MNAHAESTADYFRKMLTAVFEFMLVSGLSQTNTTRVVNAALDAVTRKRSYETSFSRPSDLVTACLVLDRWCRNRRYVDESAQPKAIPLHGPAPSIEALVKSERRRGRLDINQLRSFGLITHVGGGKYKPSSPSGVVSGLSAGFQYQVAHTLFMLLRTIRSNMSVPEKKDRLIERFAEVPDLPIECAAEFREFAKEQGSLLLQTVNDWMESRRAMTGDRVRSNGVVAGIHVYAYLGEDVSSQARSLSGSEQLK
jgi:hypothetical protein